MGEQVMTRITIGGALPCAAVTELAAAITADGAGLDWDQPLPPPQEFAAQLSAAATPLTIYARAASYGHLDEVTEFCRRYGLSYEQWVEGAGLWETCLAGWAPGMSKPGEMLATWGDEEPVVSVVELCHHLAAGRTLAEVIAAIQATLPVVPPLTLV